MKGVTCYWLFLPDKGRVAFIIVDTLRYFHLVRLALISGKFFHQKRTLGLRSLLKDRKRQISCKDGGNFSTPFRMLN